MNNFDPELAKYVLVHHCLSDEQMTELGLADNLALKFMAAKRECASSASNYDYTLISLGENCLPAWLTVKWGITPVRSQGRPLLPFDLAHSPATAVLSALETDFKDFRGDAVIENSNGLVFANFKSQMVFNHDIYKEGVSFKDNISAFNEQLISRANNFLAYCKKTNVIFILNRNSRASREVILKIYDILNTKYDISHLIILDRFLDGITLPESITVCLH